MPSFVPLQKVDRFSRAEGKLTAATAFDHIFPLSLGGSDEDANTRNLCPHGHRKVTAEQFGHCRQLRISASGWPEDDQRGLRATMNDRLSAR